MAREQGRYFKLQVGDGASPEVFTTIAGQDSLSRDASSALVDLSNKADYPYGVQAAGRADLQFTCSGKRIVPDAAGLERVHAQSIAQTATTFRVINEEPSPNVTVFEGSMYIGNLSLGDDDGEGSTFSFSLTPAAAPTTDTLD